MSRRARGLAAAVAGLLLGGCGAPRPGLTLPWFRVETIPPLVIAPHVLEIGSPRSRAYKLEAGGWVRVYDGPHTGVVAAEGGAAVVLQEPRLLLRDDRPGAQELDRGACPTPDIAVTEEGDRLLCMAVGGGREPEVTVAQLDTRGQLLRKDRLGQDPVRPWSARSGDVESRRLFGLTRSGDPVIALRSASSPTLFDVRVLRGAASEVIRSPALAATESIHGWDASRIRAAYGISGVAWSTYSPPVPGGARP